MCDIFSWATLKDGSILFLNDKDIEEMPGMDMIECIGHRAISKFYGISERDFKHREGLRRIPAVIAKEVNRGNMQKILFTEFIHSARYDDEGFLLEMVVDTEAFDGFLNRKELDEFLSEIDDDEIRDVVRDVYDGKKEGLGNECWKIEELLDSYDWDHVSSHERAERMYYRLRHWMPSRDLSEATYRVVYQKGVLV